MQMQMHLRALTCQDASTCIHIPLPLTLPIFWATFLRLCPACRTIPVTRADCCPPSFLELVRKCLQVGFSTLHLHMFTFLFRYITECGLCEYTRASSTRSCRRNLTHFRKVLTFPRLSVLPSSPCKVRRPGFRTETAFFFYVELSWLLWLLLVIVAVVVFLGLGTFCVGSDVREPLAQFYHGSYLAGQHERYEPQPASPLSVTPPASKRQLQSTQRVST